MRNILRKMTLVCLFSIFILSSYFGNSVDDNKAYVVKIENLTEDQNVQIFRFFMDHHDLKVINSCQELNLVVFKYVGNDGLNVEGLSFLINRLLENEFNISNAELLSDYSQNDVNVNCRAKKQELIGQ